MQLPFFYTAPNVARVNVAMEIATDKVKFEKEKGKLHATINILGLAYLPNGTVGARFSDALKIDFDDKKQMEAFKEQPMHYENQFDVASGKYNLKVVFASSGESFGKVEMPLAIDAYDEKQFSMSGVALSKQVHKASELGTGLDALLLEDRVPLIADGMQLVPYVRPARAGRQNRRAEGRHRAVARGIACSKRKPDRSVGRQDSHRVSWSGFLQG